MTRSTVTKMDNLTTTSTPTPGEELFLIHLHRLREDDEDDHDQPPRRKRRSSSVGEELWEIHAKRSMGMLEEEGSDRDIEVKDKNNTPKSPIKKYDTTKCCQYNLRSKDISIKKE
ncbi:MAG: hypothetical protein ACI90V_005944 [Bacillariaceae sp.]|jgi:hypothetical protein